MNTKIKTTTMSTTTLPLTDIDSIYLCRERMHILGQGEKSHVLMYIENDWIREQVLEDEVLASPKRVNVLEGSEGQPYLVFAYPYEDWDKIIKHLDASDNYDNISAEEFTEKGMRNKQRFRMECISDDLVELAVKKVGRILRNHQNEL